MKKLIYLDDKNRLFFKQAELLQIVLKSIIKNTNLLNSIRWNAVLKLSSMSKKSSKTGLVNCCVVTGRYSKIHYLYKFSRLVFLKLARFGYLPGIKKSTW